MFLVEKTNLTSHFKLIAKKPPPISKNYQLAVRSFDEKVNFHLKTIAPATDSSIISLTWMSKAVSFLSTVHSEAQEQISNLRSESDYYQALYMSYSQKVLDLCNLISSAVQQLIDRRLLLNLSLRLLNINSSGKFPASEKLKKAKDTLTRSVHHKQQISKEKAQRAKDLLEEMALAVNSLPIGKTTTARDLIRRTLHGLGSLTVFVASVLVSVLYGQSDLVEVRFPTEFLWSDSVTGVQRQVFDLIKPKQASGYLLEIEDTENGAVAVCDILDEVAGVGDGDVGDTRRVRLEDAVKELGTASAKFSNGIDELTNGVNGLFSSVMKARNGVLDGVRNGDW